MMLHKYHLCFLILLLHGSLFCDTKQNNFSGLLNAWPKTKPHVSQDKQSMFQNQIPLGRYLIENHHKISIICELGSWLGASTRFILDTVPHATVIAIDHWKGSEEHAVLTHYKKKLPTLYETFLVNCWKYKDRLIPIKETTVNGLKKLHDYKIVPDMFYVDAAHDFDSVLVDLETIHHYFPNAMICGDDWAWNWNNLNFPVRRAVQAFANKNNLKIHANKNFWYLTNKEKTSIKKTTDHAKIFTKIYKKKRWGGKESVSGSGSDLVATKTVRAKIAEILTDFHIKTILDAPCGDFWWMKEVDFSTIDSYLGIDIVEELINHNNQRYGNHKVSFASKNIVSDQLPTVDLIICRDIFLHLPFNDIFKILKNLKKSGSTFLLASTYAEAPINIDRTTIDGCWRAINLEKQPFNLPKPLILIDEQDKNKKFLGLWRLDMIAI